MVRLKLLELLMLLHRHFSLLFLATGFIKISNNKSVRCVMQQISRPTGELKENQSLRLNQAKSQLNDAQKPILCWFISVSRLICETTPCIY